jgi:hypothetical protein
MMKQIIVSVFLLTGLLQADSIGLNVNSDDVEVSGSLNLNSMIGYGNGIDYVVSGEYIHTETDDMFKVGFSASSTLSGAEGLILTLGIESVFMEDYFAMPLFGQAKLRLPLDEPIPATFLIARVDYAPSVLSFIDADNYLEYRFEADMEVIPNIHIYGGYRNIETNYETYDHTLNDNWYGGLKIGF